MRQTVKLVRIEIGFDEDLLKMAERRARRLGLTLDELVEKALRRELTRPVDRREGPEIPVFDGKSGLRPGVKAASTAELSEALERGQGVEELR